MKLFAKWHLREIISVAMLSVVLGVIFLLSDWLYTFVYAAVTPLGWGPFVGEALFGLWCMGGPLAFMLVRLPGASLISEIIGAVVESLLGGQFGVVALIAGFFQGIGSEAGFACFKYRRFDLKSLTLASVLSTIITFISALFIHGYIKLALPMLLGLFVTRLISNLIFSVGLVKLIDQILKKSKFVALNQNSQE